MGHAEFTLRNQPTQKPLSLDELWMPFTPNRDFKADPRIVVKAEGMLPAIVGALWGSSWHLVSGPTNATSLMVFATVGALAVPFTPSYVALVLTLNLMVGLMKLGLGLARLGSLVNFISTAVVIGFTAGAGLLIIGAQLRNFFGIDVPQQATFFLGLRDFVTHVDETNLAVLAVGTFTLLAALAGKRWWPRVPYMIGRS